MFNLLKKFFGWLLSPILSIFDFPVLPPEVGQIVDKFFEYLRSGMGIINFFCPLAIIRPALTIFLAVFAIYHGYQLVMWILRKIPFLGVE